VVRIVVFIVVSCLLSGCAVLYDNGGKPRAKVYWPMSGEISEGNLTFKVAPSERSVDKAAEVAALGVREGLGRTMIDKAAEPRN
jgi:hypothetical protein